MREECTGEDLESGKVPKVLIQPTKTALRKILNSSGECG
jgi:hypothetical protein